VSSCAHLVARQVARITKLHDEADDCVYVLYTHMYVVYMLIGMLISMVTKWYIASVWC
jgi:hypothetical protein